MSVRWCQGCRGYKAGAHPHGEETIPSLFDAELTPPAAIEVDRQGEAIARAAAHRDETIQARFLTFHADNPRVYELLCRFARQIRGRGYERVGIKLLWERVRWEVMIETNDPDGFKLSNDYHARYARLIMENEPDLAGLFRTRELRRE